MENLLMLKVREEYSVYQFELGCMLLGDKNLQTLYMYLLGILSWDSDFFPSVFFCSKHELNMRTHTAKTLRWATINIISFIKFCRTQTSVEEKKASLKHSQCIQKWKNKPRAESVAKKGERDFGDYIEKGLSEGNPK